MRRALIFAALVTLVACDRQDGYRFERKEFERTQPAITVVTHPTVEDLRAKAPPGTNTEGRDLMGWSIIRPTGCEMNVVDPAKSWMPEWIAHEAAHCIWGRWHS